MQQNGRGVPVPPAQGGQVGMPTVGPVLERLYGALKAAEQAGTAQEPNPWAVIDAMVRALTIDYDRWVGTWEKRNGGRRWPGQTD